MIVHIMCTPTLCTVKDNAHVYMCTFSFYGLLSKAQEGGIAHLHCLLVEEEKNIVCALCTK